MDFFTQHGGPLALQAVDGTKEGSGAEIELNDAAWSRGDVCQIGDPDTAEITGSSPWTIDGPFGHGAIPNDAANEADNAFFGVVTDTSVLEDADGHVFVKGICLANVAVNATEVLTFGQALYATENETFLLTAANPTISSGTMAGTYATVRLVATMMETVADPEDNELNLVRVLFNGIPPHLG